MLITQILSIQHQVFLTQLEFLKHVKETVQAEEVCAVRALVFAIADAMDKHAAIEEELLFPKLRPYLGEQMGPVQVMEFEHKEIRKILEALEKANDPRLIQAESSKFIILLQDHIAKEEHVLFPLAEEVLEKSVLEALAEKSGVLQPKGKAHCC